MGCLFCTSFNFPRLDGLEKWGFERQGKWLTYAGRWDGEMEYDVIEWVQAATSSAYSIRTSSKKPVPNVLGKKYSRKLKYGKEQPIVEFGGRPFKTIERAVTYRCRARKGGEANNVTIRKDCEAQIKIFKALVQMGNSTDEEIRSFVMIDDNHTSHEPDPQLQHADSVARETVLSLHEEGLTGHNLRKRTIDKMKVYVEEKKIPVDLRQRQWFPADKDYRYIVKKGRKFLSKLADVAELRCHVERWKKEGHSIHLEATQANTDGESEDFLMVAQTEAQKKLLELYGHMALLDATHKTNKYGLPLFLLVVKTPYGYQVAAMFITYNLKEVSITRALNVLKEWNPDWSPEIGMTDCDSAEVNAMKNCFPSLKDQFYCGFHVVSAWKKAVKGYFRGDTVKQDEALGLLRVLQFTGPPAKNRDNLPFDSLFQAALVKIKRHRLVKENAAFAKYIKDWTAPDKIKMWADCYRTQVPGRMNVTTSNGCETINRVIKHCVLSEALMKGRLSTVVCKLIDEYFVDTAMRLNHKASLQDPNYRRKLGDEAYPEWLQGVPDIKPDFLRKQLKASFDKCAEVACVQQPGHRNVWTCKSASVGTDGDHFGYKVDLNVPKCNCPEFDKWRLPCKHFMAVMKVGQVSFDSLPEEYRNKGYFNPVRVPLPTDRNAGPSKISIPDKRGDILPLTTEPIVDSNDDPEPNSDTAERRKAMALENTLRNQMWHVPDSKLPQLLKLMESAILSVDKLAGPTKFNNPQKPRERKRKSFVMPQLNNQNNDLNDFVTKKAKKAKK